MIDLIWIIGVILKASMVVPLFFSLFLDWIRDNLIILIT